MSEEVVQPSTPADATPSAPASPVATPQVPASQPAIPATTTPVQGVPPQEGWVPSYRIREAREAAVRQANEESARREAAIRAEADRYRSQLHSLVGVSAPPDPERQAVRDQFGRLYPGLTKIEERANEILGILERAGDLEAQNSHYWESYGRQQVNNLFEKAATSLGSPLTDEGKRALHSAFTGFVSSSPELTDRYANDPTLVDEFWTTFSSSFIDPARRAATATVAGRAAASFGLPQDTPSGAPRPSPVPGPQTLEERANVAWAMYNQNKRPGSQ